MNPLVFGSIAEIVKTVAGRIWPDPEKQAQAELEVAKLAQSGELQKMTTQMSAILAEANSGDPWTSRARPSFLYVMYIMILASIPMGFLSAFHPTVASAVAEGMKMWLSAIPDELYTLFGVGYTGYAVMRGVEKWKGGIK
jgi:hypothetical protein